MDTPLQRVRAGRRSRRATGGPDGNERLTAATAVVLLLLLAAEGVTIVFLRPLLSEHIFIGMLLIPPVVLKTASTGWRFVRYYTGDRSYRVKGPPMVLLRLLAPLVVASTTALFATGVALLVIGPGRGFVLGLHKASFVVWLVAMGLHVLAYVGRLPALAASDWRRTDPEQVGGSFARRTLLAGALVAGVILAVATYRYAQPWVHWQSSFHGGDH
ncbi:MAG TPA: hypothetical protein VII51_01640 [Gaiellaceae bacterium]